MFWLFVFKFEMRKMPLKRGYLIYLFIYYFLLSGRKEVFEFGK